MILKAAKFAIVAHAGQMRKYTARPYIEHPMRVAGRAMLLYEVTDDVIAAAWLHDVVEDCNVTLDDLAKAGFSSETISLVIQLTNPSKGVKAPRAVRKKMDRDHITTASRWAKVIKLLDRTDNINDMGNGDNDFKKLYIEESIALQAAIESHSVNDPLIKSLSDDLSEAIVWLFSTIPT